jgi:hypothetical protein
MVVVVVKYSTIVVVAQCNRRNCVCCSFCCWLFLQLVLVDLQNKSVIDELTAHSQPAGRIRE